MASYQVVCITKPNVHSASEHITHIGYYESVFKPKVIITVEEAIKPNLAQVLCFGFSGGELCVLSPYFV